MAAVNLRRILFLMLLKATLVNYVKFDTDVYLLNVEVCRFKFERLNRMIM